MGGNGSRVPGKHVSRAPEGARLGAATAWLTFAASAVGLVTALLLLGLAFHGL
jgi:hypothetical protein